MQKIRILYVNSPKYDLITALHIEGLHLVPEVELFCTSLGNYTRPSEVLSFRDAIDYGNQQADIVVLGSRPFVNTEIFWSVTSKRPLRAVMEGGDNASLDIPVRRFSELDMVFKRELFLKDNSISNFFRCAWPGKIGMWKKTRAHALVPHPYFHSLANHNRWKDVLKNALWLTDRAKIKPFPLGIESRFVHEPELHPKFQIACILRPHIPERAELLEALRQMNLPGVFMEEIPSRSEDVRWNADRGAAHPEFIEVGGIGFAQNQRYYQQLRNSRASVSVPGGGFDTLRFWEILAVGSLLISKRISTRMPNTLVEGEHYVAFDTLQEFQDAIRFVKDHPDRADEIRLNGHRYALRYHTSRARAEYFLQELGFTVSA